jgi:polyhydroxyalkanoate synthase
VTPPVSNAPGALDRVRREVERNALRTRNGIKLAAGSVLDRRPGVGLSPKQVVWRRGRAELWRYDNDAVTAGAPVLIVFSLISRSYILDLSPGNSFVERLVKAGFDVYLLDWGVPDERDAQNRLEDYVDDYIPAALQRVRERSGSNTVNLLGYCLGGNLALLHAAHHPRSPLRSLTVMATPVDFRHVGPLADIFASSGLEVDAVLDHNGNVPASVVQRAFRLLTPTADATRYVALWEKLWSDEYVAAYQAMTQWVGDHIPYPGAAARETIDMFVRDNAMVTDQLRVGDDEVHLSDIRVPFLTVLANRDHIVPPEAAERLLDLVGSADKQQLRLDAGHIGLVVGRTAARTTMPKIIEFLSRQGDDVEAPTPVPQPEESR